MNAEEAEKKIVSLVKEVDAVRAKVGVADDDKKAMIVEIEREIQDLKKITGPRKITGKYGG